MPNYLPGTGPLEGATAPAPGPRPSSASGRVVAAGLLSSVIPGTGQFLIGRWRKGLIFLLAFAAVLTVYFWLRLPKNILGVLFAILFLVAIAVFSAWDAAYQGRTPETKPSQGWVAAIIPIALIAGLLHNQWMVPAAGFRGFLIPSSSMAPAMPLGSHVVVDRWCYRHTVPRRGDIVVADSPADPGIYVAKRVIAVGGDKIEVRGDTVILNDSPLAEPYVLLEGPVPNVLDRVRPITLPPGKLFLMGDNRHLSYDSRAPKFGLVDISAVRGKVIYSFTMNGLKTFD